MLLQMMCVVRQGLSVMVIVLLRNVVMMEIFVQMVRYVKGGSVFQSVQPLLIVMNALLVRTTNVYVVVQFAQMVIVNVMLPVVTMKYFLAVISVLTGWAGNHLGVQRGRPVHSVDPMCA